MTIVC